MRNKLKYGTWRQRGRVAGLCASALIFVGTVVTAADGIYTAAQAARGEAIYSKECAVCHQPDLTGRNSDGGPTLVGLRFTSRWGGLSVQDLIRPVQELMPARHRGSLTEQQYVDVVSFILKKNGLPAGKTELPANPEALKKIVVRFER